MVRDVLNIGNAEIVILNFTFNYHLQGKKAFVASNAYLSKETNFVHICIYKTNICLQRTKKIFEVSLI